uniref:Uncharacterized protein n=1 Tax=Rhizophora mucronata TaxID=61149 RepID=A0A2P2P6K3_RHIMU
MELVHTDSLDKLWA